MVIQFSPRRARCSAQVLITCVVSTQVTWAQDSLKFTNITAEARVNVSHQIVSDNPNDAERIAAGVAAGDFDRDGFVDLFVVGGNGENPNGLFRNLANGKIEFEPMGQQMGLDVYGKKHAGAALADIDNDGWLDLWVGGIDNQGSTVYRNQSGQSFENVTESSGLGLSDLPHSFSAAFSDFDLDGDLDLALSHWDFSGSFDFRAPLSSTETLWVNDGAGHYTDWSSIAGLTDAIGGDGLDFSFTPNFADLNGDGWPDLLMAADFNTSQYFLNLGDGRFEEATSPVISDLNGMGAAVGDYDNDGDQDWFVTAIRDPSSNDQIDGNRLYRNDGQGIFEDVTQTSGVRDGGWGWGACFADFNNDGWLDIFHVNGWPDPRYQTLPSKLFIGSPEGIFHEQAEAAGLFTDREGRGLVCSDFDRDGDIDIFIANNRNFTELYRNDSELERQWLTIALYDELGNRQAIGATIKVQTASLRQTREIRFDGHFVSHSPAEAHFGLGDAEKATVSIRWPDGEQTQTELDSNQFVEIRRQATQPRIVVWSRDQFPGNKSLPIFDRTTPQTNCCGRQLSSMTMLGDKVSVDRQ